MDNQFVSLDLNMPLLRAAEVAQFLNVSRALAYRLMNTGEIPIVRVNRSVRVRRIDLEAYIRDNLVSGHLGEE